MPNIPKPFPILSGDNDSEDRRHKVIGKGAYGCVHKPSLHCKNKTVKSYKDKVSKFMITKHANTEMTEYETIEKADPKNKLYLGKPIKCAVKKDNDNENAIDKCNMYDWKYSTHSLLVMEDGGENLSDFATRFKLNPITPENKEKMELFWIEAQRILYGLTVFFQNDIVHHDLKAQNIVYNEEKNRINFIDFGLMTSKQKIIKKCNESDYSLAIWHWSFPFELRLMNKSYFNRISKMNRNEKKKYIKNFVENNITKGKGNSLKTFFSQIFGHLSESIQEENINIVVNDFKDFILDDFKNYDYILNKCINTIDMYGAGMGFSKVLSNTSQFIEPALATDLAEFVMSMLSNHLPSRVEPLEALHQYEELLEKHGLLTKYKKHFENHILQDKVEKETKIDKQINNIKNVDLKMTPEEQANLYLPPTNKICPEGKELNPFTNRCVTVCKDDQIRNEKFKCVKNKNINLKMAPEHLQGTNKICPEGKELNPLTNRCVTICKDDEMRNDKFKCVKNKTRKNKK
jgi:serine/threonine protein kinase